MTPSYFRNTVRGETYLKRLCNEDDIENGVEVAMPPTPPYTRPLKLFGTQTKTFIANITREMSLDYK